MNLKHFLNEELNLQYHKILNPLIWSKNKKLRPNIHNRLIKIANAWSTFAGIPQSAVVDIIFSGGNANYNYTYQSDIDIHIVIDKSKINIPKNLINDYFWDKKMLWTYTHDIKIKSYAVELYAQDKEEKYPKNQAVYSLKDQKWIQEPKQLDLDFNSNTFLKKKSDHFKKTIDHLISHKMSDTAYNKIKNKLSKMRNSGIAKNGEFSDENLVFKELRNSGYLDKMNNYIKKKQDKKLSLV